MMRSFKRVSLLAVTYFTCLATVMMNPLSAVAAAAPTNVEDAILAHLEARQSQFSVAIPADEEQNVSAMIHTVLLAHTYLALDISEWRYLETSFGLGDLVNFSITYRETAAQYQAVLRGVRYVLHKYILKPGMDVYAKEKAIHDFVVLNVAYDQSLTHYTAYDALYDHTATCQGFAMLTYQLLRAAGIDNIILSGTAVNALGKAAHAWNEVKLAGRWYQLDTTWDDPIPFVKGRVLYDYFNLTSAQLGRNHFWNKAGLPVANTNYIAVLQASRNKSDRAILQQTGLFAEEPQDTFASLAKLQADLAAAKPKSNEKYLFRFPYRDMDQLHNLQLPYAATYSYQQDARDPVYALVTLTVMSS